MATALGISAFTAAEGFAFAAPGISLLASGLAGFTGLLTGVGFGVGIPVERALTGKFSPGLAEAFVGTGLPETGAGGP